MIPPSVSETSKELAKLLAKVKNSPELSKMAQGMGIIEKKKSLCESILDTYITECPLMKEEKRKVLILSRTQRPVLLLGETGTGKEILARALHGERLGNFVAVNCAGISEMLLESEFFGSIAGAYTGAAKDLKGYIEHAANGTLFLDEISELPLNLQTKFLRVLENKTFRVVRDVNEKNVTCRIIAATNVLDLEHNKHFRRDLYYRIAGSVIRTTPLRDRRIDIQSITVSVDKQCRIPEELINQWVIDDKKYPFVGNVRELMNMINGYLELGEIV